MYLASLSSCSSILLDDGLIEAAKKFGVTILEVALLATHYFDKEELFAEYRALKQAKQQKKKEVYPSKEKRSR